MPIRAETHYSQELQERLQAALLKQGVGYKPRTEFLFPGGKPKYTNRLILENSPYLIQHAHNPVNWYPWGEEAFAKAKKEDKPIFLSIGYSTCHWCHVMEVESFDNELMAKYLNDHFISIKVDREQLPDIDSYYMTGVMITTGHGGWPMSNFLMPDGKPFYGGTYFPPEQFRQLLERISHLWKAQRQDLAASAEKVAEAIAKTNASKTSAQNIDQKVISAAIQGILQGYDDFQGGFSPAPKFPNEPSLFLLLQQMERSHDAPLNGAVYHTLNAMAQGGIYDQIGGGFHRYATDNAWLTPHFEKMLYNQAHLARIYLHAYRISGDPLYARVARQTLDYVLREMKAPEGGFYSATDADSEGEEGLFFVWKKAEINSALPSDLATLTVDLFGVSERGNFEGRNILNLPLALDDYAKARKLELSKLFSQVDTIRDQLWQVREKKLHPLRDDKILTAWNGMMISALAEATQILNNPVYLDSAKLAAEFLWKNSRQDSGQLYRTFLNGTASVAAAQEDYAYLAEGLLRLFDVTGDSTWLQKAEQTTDIMLQEFWDAEQGGFFMASQSKVVPKMQRLKEVHDGAIPSGNSVALRTLVELTHRTGKSTYEDKAVATIAAFSEQIAANPSAYAYLLFGVDQLLGGEIGATQYAARGAVSIQGQLVPAEGEGYWLTINLSTKPGWHINAHVPLQKELIATKVSLDDKAKGWKLEPVLYPEPLTKTLKFQQSVLALYEGKVMFKSKVKPEKSAGKILRVKVDLQACNDQHCLAPETLLLNISTVAAN